MFVWTRDHDVLLTLQTDHMAQVGDFATAWGAGRFGRPAHLAAAVTAARCHDEGWRDWELDPEIDEQTGLPVDFIQVPRDRHVHFYRRGVSFLLDANPQAAVLVSRHGTGLYLGRYGVDGEEVPDRSTLRDFAREFVDEQEALQRELIESHGLSEEDILLDYRLLQAWDRLSICFCHGRQEARLGPVPAEDGGEGVVIHAVRVDATTVRLTPFPFSGDEQAFPVRTFVMPRRRYESRAELDDVLAATRATVTTFRAVR